MKSRNKLKLSMEITRQMLLITSGLSYSEKLQIFLQSYLHAIEMESKIERMIAEQKTKNKGKLNGRSR